MRHVARVPMSMRELDRLRCIQAVVDGDLSSGIAADLLGISTRQLRRIAQRYRAEGPTGLISRHCSRPSNSRLDASLEAQVVKILRESYPDFGSTLAAEKLQQRHGITVAKETLRRVQMDAGLWIPRELRPPKIQQPRARRACFGELIQIDGSEHYHAGDSWTEGSQLHYFRVLGTKGLHHNATFITAHQKPPRHDEAAPACATGLGLD